jgi:hypothetical protein
MGNEPNICCDNTRDEVNWFETEKPSKVRMMAPKEEKTQSSIAIDNLEKDKEKRQKIWRNQEESSLNIS